MLNSSAYDNLNQITFNENEMFLILLVTVPTQLQNQNIGFFCLSDPDLEFLYRGSKTAYNEIFFYFNVGTESQIYIPVRRNPGITNRNFLLQLLYFALDTSQLQILDRDGPLKIIFKRDTNYRAFLIPIVEDRAYFYYTYYDENNQISVTIDSNIFFNMFRHIKQQSNERTLYFC